MKDRHSSQISSLCLAALFVTITLMTGGALAVGPPDPPDLTKGETKGIELKHGTYNLGSTGLRGWIYHNPASNLDMRQGRTTIASRQILVTHVGAKSPADGKIQVNDVILGVGGKPFTDDARKSIAQAIQEAEKRANGGILTLTRWRAGKTDQVQLKLRVMGTYSDTAPYNCPKSKRIFEEACKHLEQEPLEDNLWGAINGLAYGGGALMSSIFDVRIGCERTSFRFLAAAYGRVNSTWTLPLIVGGPMAKEIMFTGHVVEAEEALRIGLLNKLVASSELMKAAVEMGQTIAANDATMVQAIKEILIQDIGMGWREQLLNEVQTVSGSSPPPPPRESFRDFLERKER